MTQEGSPGHRGWSRDPAAAPGPGPATPAGSPPRNYMKSYNDFNVKIFVYSLHMLHLYEHMSVYFM